MGAQKKPTLKDLRERIDAAMGRRPVDLLLKGGTLVDVLSGAFRREDIAVSGGRIVGFGIYRSQREIDISGRFVSPGFIDAHVHLESSMVTPAQYARATAPHGTTAVVADPHEIANVMGSKGIRWMIRSGQGNPLHLFMTVPSCVPATSLETSGATLSHAEVEALIEEPWVLGIGEMMNFPAVISAVPAVLKKLAVSHGKRIDGHAPGLSGRHLSAYVTAGITSDHECTTGDEALEKLKSGMAIMIREGSSAKNLSDLTPVVTRENARRFMLVSDDRHPGDLLHEGHMDAILRKAIHLGLDPMTAIRMVTLNPAEHYGLHDLGAIAPGYRADLVVLDDLRSFRVAWVIHGGRTVVEDGTLRESIFRAQPPPLPSSVHVPRVHPDDLRLVAKSGRVRVIHIVPDQITTGASVESIPVVNGFALPDPERDILKIAVVERHRGSGRIAEGFVKGFGLREGAIGSSFSHDAHNIVVVGTNDADMALAVNEISRLGGGLVAAARGRLLDALALPLAGLLSDRPVEEVDRKLEALQSETKAIGGRLESPFMTLSFLALPVIPKLKITDKGLVDVDASHIVDVFL